MVWRMKRYCGHTRRHGMRFRLPSLLDGGDLNDGTGIKSTRVNFDFSPAEIAPKAEEGKRWGDFFFLYRFLISI